MVLYRKKHKNRSRYKLSCGQEKVVDEKKNMLIGQKWEKSGSCRHEKIEGKIYL